VFGLLPLTGVMPIGCVLPARASGVWWLAVEISMVVAAWCRRLLGRSSMAHPLNKLVVEPLDSVLEASGCAGMVETTVLSLFFNHRGDGGGERTEVALQHPAWRGYMAASSGGVLQLQLIDAVVIHGQRNHSALRCCSCNSFINLLAGVLFWRPFSYSVMALIVKPSPSGLVPGGGADGQDVECIFFFGGEGPDCFCKSFRRVLLVISEDLAIILLSSKVLDVTCNPTF
jgi:hypothetical protein